MKCLINFFASLSVLLITMHGCLGQHGVSFAEADWQFACQRDALAPAWRVEAPQGKEGPSWVLAGNGKAIANGHFFAYRDVEAGAWYRFQAYFHAQGVEEPARCILSRILWEDAQGQQVGRAEYPLTLAESTADDRKKMEARYQVPEETVRARIELIYRWDADGQVRFNEVSFEKTTPPTPRKVKVAAVHHRPRNTRGPRENLEQFAGLIEQAAQQEADIICLPEAMTLPGTGLDYVAVSEPIPGPSTRFLGEIARTHQVYLVAGLLEREGEAVYNTAVLIDRQGRLAGTYRKISLPREEIEGGVTPGDALPVFDTEFGTLGMMICWDVSFPETARTLATKGAEMIFLPIAGGNLTLAKARAIENQLYLISSTYDMKTAVFNPEGTIMAEATEQQPVIVVEIDLNQRTYWPWLGDFKSRIPREMPPKKPLKGGNWREVIGGREKTAVPL